jgi:hypothetical protein
VISGSAAVLDELRTSVWKVKKQYGIRELKFAKIDRFDSRDYKAAVSITALVIRDYCHLGKTRLDVMTWDTTDSRHAIPGRNDIENLARLYYHLLSDIIGRWSTGLWYVILDRDEKVDFNNLRNCLNSSSSNMGPGQFPLITESISQLIDLDNVKGITEADSKEEPLLQVADLFAGIGRYSCERGDECCRWLATKNNPAQLMLQGLAEGVQDVQNFSRSQECRFRLIDEINKVCKRFRLGVSLETENRLWTPSPLNPVNFWFYRPQGDYDRAPTA